MGLKAGDKMTVEIEGVSREFTFAGSFRDAVCGTELIGTKRFIMNGEDFDGYMSDETTKNMYGGKFLYIHTADLDKVLSQIADISDSFTFAGDTDMLGQAYIFDMIITGLILVVSLILIIISFAVLRFTIAFTLSGEFRDPAGLMFFQMRWNTYLVCIHLPLSALFFRIVLSLYIYINPTIPCHPLFANSLLRPIPFFE